MRGALCLSGQVEARLVAASFTRRLISGSRLAALRPSRLRRLAGDLGALLLGEFAGASGTTLEAAETTELDGGGILRWFVDGWIGCARSPWLGEWADRFVAARLVSVRAFRHSSLIMQRHSERSKERCSRHSPILHRDCTTNTG
jgi:hypothetical protein